MKTGILVEGGGMKDAYCAGVLDAFLDKNINFDYAIGVSAGATCLASFLAGQRDRNRRFFTVHPKNPEYFGLYAYLKSGDIFNMHYIYDTLTNEGGGDPLDYDALLSNPTEFVFVATDVDSGKPRYFTKKDIVKNDSRPFKATCALPVFCKPITIEGHRYCDGGVSDSLPFKKAFHDGVDRLVVILSKPLDFVMEPQKHKVLYTLKLRKEPRVIWRLNNRYKMYNKQHSELLSLIDKKEVFVFAPKEQLSTYSMDTKVLQKLYDEGLFDGISGIADMQAFLEGKDNA